MQLGLSSYACAWSIGVPGHMPEDPLDAVGLIRLASRLGLHLVQLADNLPILDYHAVSRTALQCKVNIELGIRGIEPLHLRRHIRLCEQLKCNFLRVVVDTREHEPTASEAAAALRAILPDLHGAGLTLGIENHDRFDSKTFVSIISDIGDPSIGICLDTVNSFGALEGPEVVVKTLAPFVVNLHLKDFVVRRASHSMGFEITGTPAGQGQLDIPWLLSVLSNAGRDPNAIIEHWPAPDSTLAETIAKERRWCDMSVAHLRTLIRG